MSDIIIPLVIFAAFLGTALFVSEWMSGGLGEFRAFWRRGE
ncbi:hypothetical protein [Tsuneonella aeria]|nr:hypothetical protein [Tsuneonella aeria]